MNAIREKMLLLLLGGLALGCSYTAGQQWKVLKTVSREWKKLSKDKLRKEISNSYRIKLINKEESNDGSIMISLTEKGKLKALNCQLNNIKNKKEKWDGKWRMVAFDIPERFKKGRDALRHRLKEIGFRELQKSLFICPYNCMKEMKLFINFFNLNKYVRFAILEFLDNEDDFKKVFRLI